MEIKKVLLILSLFVFFQIQAQKSLTDRLGQKHYDALVKLYAQMALINTFHENTTELISKNINEKRDRLDLGVNKKSQTLSDIYELNLDGFSNTCYNYIYSGYPTGTTFYKNPSQKTFRAIQNTYKNSRKNKKLDREIEYMKIFGGKKVLGETNELKISEGNRILLILGGMETIIQDLLAEE